MRAKINKETLEKIKYLFSRAKKTKNNTLSRRYVTLARQIAKRSNTRIPEEYRRMFCHKCNTYFHAKNIKKRIKKGMISIKCLNCGHYVRYKIK